MFRKIHSNRDPRDTLLSQIRLVFSPHWDKVSLALIQKVKSHPRLIYAMMVIFILLSIAYSLILQL